MTIHLRIPAAAALLALCAACGTTSASRFFALTALEPEGTGGAVAPGVLDPVQVADYLRRPQMLRRRSAVELEIDEYSRWAEPLDLALTRVLEQDLGVLLGERAAGARLSCSVTRFEQDEEGRAVLEARYTLRPADAARLPRARTWIARAPLSRRGDAAALAQALDGLVHDFARALAAAFLAD